MSKRTSYVIKKEILLQVKEKPATYAQLERKVNTGYRTIKNNCEELASFDLIKVKSKKHPANGREAHIVQITQKGIQASRKK